MPSLKIIVSVVNVVCCIGRGLCDRLITRPGSPTKCGVSECDQVQQ
jgi:hypothetical protein